MPHGRCRLFHRWRKHLRVNDAPMAMDPVGFRECERCGKRQRYSYDSQGGCWVTVPPRCPTNADGHCRPDYIEGRCGDCDWGADGRPPRAVSRSRADG